MGGEAPRRGSGGWGQGPLALPVLRRWDLRRSTGSGVAWPLTLGQQEAVCSHPAVDEAAEDTATTSPAGLVSQRGSEAKYRKWVGIDLG